MPPKPKFTKEQIVDAAFSLAREKGIQAVVAREVGKRLNTSSSPIFTVWDSMEDLKAEVFLRAKETFLEYMSDVLDYTPAFKEYGMRWIRFAVEEPHLHDMLFLHRSESLDVHEIFSKDFAPLHLAIQEEMQQRFHLSPEDAEDICHQLNLHGAGIACLHLQSAMPYEEAWVSRSISGVCIGLVINAKLRDGTFDLETAKIMAQSALTGVSPVKKTTKG